MLRVGKYDFKTRKMPSTPGYTNVLVHTSGELSPYVMKDQNGCIMENIWQAHKYYASVTAQKQTVHHYTSEPGWVHPAEVHVQPDGKLTEAYWKWRAKLLHFPVAVRYPNGFHGRSKCLFAACIESKDSGSSAASSASEDTAPHVARSGSGTAVLAAPAAFESAAQPHVPTNVQRITRLGYIDARKRIYCRVYARLAKQTHEFQELKRRLDQGEKLQIVEVDGPRYAPEFPYNQVKEGSIEINETNIQGLLHSPQQPFGHGYVLAVTLLGKDKEWLE